MDDGYSYGGSFKYPGPPTWSNIPLMQGDGVPSSAPTRRGSEYVGKLSTRVHADLYEIYLSLKGAPTSLLWGLRMYRMDTWILWV